MQTTSSSGWVQRVWTQTPEHDTQLRPNHNYEKQNESENLKVHGDQKVSVHLMITAQKNMQKYF
jgi:hypothetical protein